MYDKRFKYCKRIGLNAKQKVRIQDMGLLQAHKLKDFELMAFGSNVNVNLKKWFLEGKDDTKSSYYMEEVTTEFDIQGLEIDYAIVGWDADYRYENGILNVIDQVVQNGKLLIKRR